MLKINKRYWILVGTIFAVWLALVKPVEAEPWVNCQYYCLMDRTSGQVLLSNNGEKMRQVASTTKIMTAILAEEYAGLEETAEVSEHADKTLEYTIGLRTGQKVMISELMKAALIRSANDAAVVLGEHVAGDEALFGHLMSLKAFAIGAANTHFCNASGLPAVNNYSTATDLAVIGRYALSHPYLQKMVGTAQIQFQHPGYRQPLTIRNTNGLLTSYAGADGIKTGTTNAAGKCLVASASRNGRKLIAVVLNSADRQGDCQRLLNYGFKNYSLGKIIDHQTPFKTIKVEHGNKPYVTILAKEDMWAWTDGKRPRLEKVVKMNYHIAAPVTKGQKVGELNVYSEGKLVKTIELICGEDIGREPGLLKKIYKHILN
ncbi:MAG TPA: D-alanyl-D-alanine carboxypeptidase family protein [Syntrophomonadaceae bacterium]|nr:D-alanyl-D-alanine carboxypeptidase family protein [Syntrophomonadaceae bacterium]